MDMNGRGVVVDMREEPPWRTSKKIQRGGYEGKLSRSGDERRGAVVDMKEEVSWWK